MRFFKKIYLFLLLFFFSILFSACSYSFTGSSVPPHLKTVFIPVCRDNSQSGIGYLSHSFDENLQKKFVDDNSLSIIDGKNADSILECVITGFTDQADFVSGTNQSSSTRKVTVTVKAVYKDLIKKKTVFDKSFSNNYNYDASKPTDTSVGRENAIKETLRRISEDILLNVVSNW